MLSALLMLRRLLTAVPVALRDEGFAPVAAAAALLVTIGTLTYTLSQGWELVDGFYFAVATLTTSSVADPTLTIEGDGIKLFTAFYILLGIGILVELARRIGFAFMEVRRGRSEARRATRGG